MPAFSLGKSKRQEMGKNDAIPGPGAYSQKVETLVENSPSWTMGSIKKDIENKNIVPGPGTYNTSQQATKVNAHIGQVARIQNGNQNSRWACETGCARTRTIRTKDTRRKHYFPVSKLLEYHLDQN